MTVGEKFLYENPFKQPGSGNNRSVMRSLTKIVLRNVQFRCNEIWYVQSDGLAMGGSLAVKLANAWIKLFEASLQKPEFENYL